jgi:AcrR family transcriptional regulator
VAATSTPSTSATAGSAQRRIRGLDAEQRRQQRRDALLTAGLDLFASQGFINTTIEQLCQHAYVGTKAFYETFASREDLYAALLGGISNRVLGDIAQLAADHPDLDEDVLLPLLLSAFAHAFVDDVRYAKVTFGEGSAITPEAERQRRGNRRAAASFVESLWQRYAPAPVEAGHGIAIGVIGGLFDIVADWVLDLEAPEPAAEEIDLLVSRLLTFYRAVRHGML